MTLLLIPLPQSIPFSPLSSPPPFAPSIEEGYVALKGKAKVVTTVRGAKFPCSASCFASVDLEKGIDLFFHKDQGKTASVARN